MNMKREILITDGSMQILRDIPYEENPESFIISKIIPLSTNLLDNWLKGSTLNTLIE